MTRNTANIRTAQLLGSPPVYTISELAREAGTTIKEAEDFWMAMGFPKALPDEVLFGPADVRALAREVEMVRSQKLDENTSHSMVRALSHATDRLVLWQQEALVDRLMNGLGLDSTSARLVLLDRIMEYIDHMQSQLDYAYRRQLGALLERTDHDLDKNSSSARQGDSSMMRALGFLDMVNYTKRSQELSEKDLAEIVQSFEQTCRDVIARNGARVVKTLGDAVLYIADDLPTAARTVTEMVEEIKRNKKMLPVRASLSWGGVVSRFGDVFGSVVNLASRLTAKAPPGTVLCDEDSATILANSSEGHLYEMESFPTVELQGLGKVDAVLLRRLAITTPNQPYRDTENE